MVEHRAGPGGGGVAGRAGCRESRSDVIGIGGAGVIRLVARVAIGRRTGKFVVHVACGTGNAHVRAGERE